MTFMTCYAANKRSTRIGSFGSACSAKAGRSSTVWRHQASSSRASIMSGRRDFETPRLPSKRPLPASYAVARSSRKSAATPLQRKTAATPGMTRKSAPIPVPRKTVATPMPRKSMGRGVSAQSTVSGHGGLAGRAPAMTPKRSPVR